MLCSHGLPLFFADPVDFTISTARVRPHWWSSGSGKYAIIRASETEQHHALYCAVRRFRRAGGGRA